MKTLGQILRELREQKDLSLREFASRLGGLSAAFISDIELGRRFPSEDVLVKMAKVLGTSVEELKKYDNRAPMEDLKRLAASDPTYGFALRQVIEKKVTGEQLLDMMKQAERKIKK